MIALSITDEPSAYTLLSSLTEKRLQVATQQNFTLVVCGGF